MSKYNKGDKVIINSKGIYDWETEQRFGGSKTTTATVTKVFTHGVRTNKGYCGNKYVSKE